MDAAGLDAARPPRHLRAAHEPRARADEEERQQQRAEHDEAGALPGRVEEVVPAEGQLEVGQHVHVLASHAAAARGREPREDLGEHRDLLGAQVVEEALLHGGVVRRLGRTGEVEPGRGQVGVDGACVRRAGPAGHQLAALEDVDDARDPAEAQPRLLRDDREPQPALGRRREAPEDLQGAQAQAVGGLQLGVERPGEPAVRLQQADPRVGVGVRPARQPVVTHDVRACLCSGVGLRRHCACQDKDSPRAHRTCGTSASAPWGMSPKCRRP